MPFYEYRCDACGHELEELQKISDPVLRKCPECKKLKLKKLVSAAAFKLTGTGWYETDFKNNDKAGKDNKSSEGQSGEAKNTSGESQKSGKEKSTTKDKKEVKGKKKESKAPKTKPDAK